MMNPISRAIFNSTYSTTAIAKKLGVSRQYVSRLTQGLYDKPNQKILEWAAEILNQDPSEVSRDYRIWQKHKRSEVLDRIALEPMNRIAQISGEDFRSWREEYWQTSHAFCVDMCIHPSPVADFEDGTSPNMPMTLKAVLMELELI